MSAPKPAFYVFTARNPNGPGKVTARGPASMEADFLALKRRWEARGWKATLVKKVPR